MLKNIIRKKQSYFLVISVFTILLLGILTFTVYAEEDLIVGHAKVIDGDTIDINGQRIRLAYIDAPETKQQCFKQKVGYSCGMFSKDTLSKLAEIGEFKCVKLKLDIYKRILGECFLFDININKFMVRSGNAILYRNTKIYQESQIAAENESVGIWGYDFQEPWLWRKTKKS